MIVRNRAQRSIIVSILQTVEISSAWV